VFLFCSIDFMVKLGVGESINAMRQISVPVFAKDEAVL
jgi:hypothetical protein